MKRENTIWGVFLIVIGGLFLVNNFFETNLLSIGNLWPAIILALGLSFEVGYFSKGRNPGVLVPGGILTTLGILFFFETITDWRFSEYTWPIYILAVAIGLFQLYLFSGRNKGLLIPVLILTAVSLFSFVSMIYNGIFSLFSFNLFAGIVIIIIGIGVLFKNKGFK